MPHISLPKSAPGILGPLQAFPDTGRHLSGLAQALLRGPSSLTPAERETIAAFVSSRNECFFCTQSHAGAARCLLGEAHAVVDLILRDGAKAAPTEKLRALLAIAEAVVEDGRNVTEPLVHRARELGADDKAIHDTVLIAAAFCMFNRYVDGLGTSAPRDSKFYEDAGKRLAEKGYEG